MKDDDVTDEEQKAYNESLRERIEMLKVEIDAGNVKVAEGLSIIESLKNVRYNPDGSINLDTVDGSVRAIANCIAAYKYRDRLKNSISLAEVQNSYFDFIEQNFGQFYKVMVERKLTPHEAGLAASSSEGSIRELTENLSDLLAYIHDFWSKTAEIVYAHVEDMRNSLTGVFGGDLFPAHNENLASKCGLYTDTIILPCPFLRSSYVFERSPLKQRAYYLIRHALSLLQYKELACCDIIPPIVVVLPDYSYLEQDERDFCLGLGKADALIHASRIFGREFDSFEDLMEFAGRLDNIEKVQLEVRDPTRVLFDSSIDGSLKEQLEASIGHESSELLGTKNPGVIVATQALGRMGNTNELLVKARRLRGSPLIEAPTSWQYFVWKLEYDSEGAAKELGSTNLHVIRGLANLADKEMEWLGRIPPDALIAIRKDGAIGEIRNILRAGIKDLTEVNPQNFHRTSDRIFDNVHTALQQHRENIRKLSKKKWKFAGKEIGPWIVTGSIAVTAAATGYPVWALAAIAADQLLDTPKLKDIPKSIKELAIESSRVRHSPVGILYKLSQS